MGRPRKIVNPEEAAQEQASTNTQADEPQNQTETSQETTETFSKRFIKNINPNEKIVLEDKTIVQFPKGSTAWIVKDKDLSEKLEKVAGKYSIIIS